MNQGWFTRPQSHYPRHVVISPENETRVVEIQPGAGSEPIRCHLSVQSMDAKSISQFDALSYVWGDWRNHGIVSLNGIHGFPVTRNLLKALRRLRRRDRPHRLWIDQMSINQQDQTERKRQVKQMGHIFARARHVILWFGDADEHLESVSTDTNSNILKALQHAINNDLVEPWWTRAWVIEEYALAKEEPIVMFGPYRLKWGELLHLARKSQIVPVVPVSRWARFAFHLLYYERLRDPSFERNLHSFSIFLNETSTLNPRDKVYCILPSLPETERKLIMPGYDQPVSEVFARATYASIASTGSIGILNLVSRLSAENSFNIPSWALDFTFPEKKKTFRVGLLPLGGLRDRVQERMFRSIQMFINDSVYRLFNFKGAQRSWCQKQPQKVAEVSFDPSDHKRLTLTGLDFDGVLHVVGVHDSNSVRSTISGSKIAQSFINDLDPSSESRIVSWIDSSTIKSHSGEIYATMQKRLSNGNPYHQVASSERKNLQVLLSSSSYQQTIQRGVIPALFKRWDHAARPKKAKRTCEFSLLLVKKRFSYDSAWLNDERGWDEYMRGAIFKFYLEMDSTGMSFFVTTAGFFGLGPVDLKADDRIVLLYGSRYPIALRRSRNNNWLFVGFCYVRGIMDEELWDCFPEMHLREMKFVLE